MTAKEKAIELLDEMSIQTYSYQPYAGAHYNIEEIGYEAGKKCALIAVDEIFKTNTLEDRNCGFVTLCEKHKEYWQEVKQEIEKI